MKKTLLFLCAIVLLGCSSAPKRPDWVRKGAAAFPKEQKTFYGMGTVEGVKSESLRRTTADNRAIAEVSRQVSVVSTSMMRDYMASTSVTATEKSSGEQYIESTVKTFASNTLSGIKIIDRWDNGRTAYSLASLNVENLKSLTDQATELSENVKKYIKENAEKAFDKLEAGQANQQK